MRALYLQSDECLNSGYSYLICHVDERNLLDDVILSDGDIPFPTLLSLRMNAKLVEN